MMRPIDVWRLGIECLLTGYRLPAPRDDAERVQLRALRNFVGVYGRTEDAVRAMLENVRRCVCVNDGDEK